MDDIIIEFHNNSSKDKTNEVKFQVECRDGEKCTITTSSRSVRFSFTNNPDSNFSDEMDESEFIDDELDVTEFIDDDEIEETEINADQEPVENDSVDDNASCNPEPVSCKYEDLSIDELELSIRSYNCLMRAGVRTLGDIRAMSDDELMRVRNLGRKSYEEIKDKLRELQEISHREDSFEKKDYFEMLHSLIGLEGVKAQVEKIVAFAKMKKDFSARGLQAPPVVLNMEFVGNPGTAKTTVARILAGILSEIGILNSPEIVEVGRADLVARYEGQTADKVKRLFSDSKGRLLFIDEAYSLVEQWEGAYGDEAINTIVQEMENNREDIIVVFAGYPDKMKEFFDVNPGLRSRVPFSIEFKDYSTEEMTGIVDLEAKNRGFAVSHEAEGKIKTICENAVRNPNAGNGRFCRNLVDSAVLSFAARVYGNDEEQVGAEKQQEHELILSEDDFAVPDDSRESIKSPIGFVAGAA